MIRARPRKPAMFRAFLRDAAGAAAVELSLIAPFLLIGAIGVADLGLPVWRRMQVQAAAQAGAQYAAINGFDAQAIAGVVAGATNFAAISAYPPPAQFCGCSTGDDVAAAACGSTCASGEEAGDYVRVQTSAQSTRLFAYFTGGVTTTVAGRATIRVK